MSRQLSRNQPTAEGETGEASRGELLGVAAGDDEDMTCCDRVMASLFLCFLCLLGIFFVGIPVVMVAVGATYFPDCGEASPYPLWLIVGGTHILVFFLYTIILMVTETKNLGLYCICGLLLIFPLVWYVFGCWWLWGCFTHPKSGPRVHTLIYNLDKTWLWSDFLESDCVYPYWFVFWLVVSPLCLLALGVGLVILAGIILCFSTSIDDDEGT